MKNVVGLNSGTVISKNCLSPVTTGELYDHHDASGFITLFGLPCKVRAMVLEQAEKNK